MHGGLAFSPADTIFVLPVMNLTGALQNTSHLLSVSVPPPSVEHTLSLVNVFSVPVRIESMLLSTCEGVIQVGVSISLYVYIILHIGAPPRPQPPPGRRICVQYVRVCIF